ncbi:hypothetical protein D3C86_1795500 [compost metagenome]
MFQVHAGGAGGQLLLPDGDLVALNGGRDDHDGQGRSGQLGQDGQVLVDAALGFGEGGEGFGQFGAALRAQHHEAPGEELAVVRGAGAEVEDLLDLGLGRAGGGQKLGRGRAAHGQTGQDRVRADGQGQGGVEIGHAV